MSGAGGDGFARTPKPPYYAVVFTSRRTDGDDGYGATADRMMELAATQPGCLGVETVRDERAYGKPGSGCLTNGPSSGGTGGDIREGT